MTESEWVYDTRAAETRFLCTIQREPGSWVSSQAVLFALWLFLKSHLIYLLIPLFLNSEVIPKCWASSAICEPWTPLQAKRAAWSNQCTQIQFITSKDLEEFSLSGPCWLDEGKFIRVRGARSFVPLPSLPFLFNLNSPFNFRSPSPRMLVKWVHLNKPVGGELPGLVLLPL